MLERATVFQIGSDAGCTECVAAGGIGETCRLGLTAGLNPRGIAEREAVVAVLDRFRAGEAGGHAAFSGWEKTVSTDCIRSGIRMIAERENYHSRVFEQRPADLGVECKAPLTDFGRKLTEKLSDSEISDNDKLLYLASLAPDPDAFWKPVLEVVDRIKDDQESKELFKLYIQDEFSSGKWLLYACEALNGPAKAASAGAVAASDAL